MAPTGCLEHGAVPNCQDFSPANKDICLACKSNFVLFAPQQLCQQVVAVANCKTYAGPRCGQCDEGHLLDTELGTCEDDANFPNCAQLSNGACSLCEAAFFL